jgi:hypothetical protein
VWSHGITPRKSDIVPLVDGGLTLLQRELRTSFTFRKLTGVKPSQLIRYFIKNDHAIYKCFKVKKNTGNL